MRRSAALHRSATDAAKDFAGDVEYYLTQQPRQLPSRYLYDALGSVLFDAICELPWYGITRAELHLLAQHGGDIFARAGAPSRILELGPGNGSKLMRLIEASRYGGRRLELHLIDVSAAALASASRALGALDDVDVVTHEAPYEALADVTRTMRVAGPMLVLFLGSNIGNFDRPDAEAFLKGIRGALAPGDALVLGVDLVKPERDLQLAYDDPLGVTAAFNRNLLVRINRELGGTFDLDAFGHRAVWNAQESRVEMHLVSLRDQRVRVAAASIDFSIGPGESIWTESSYKYQPEEIVAMAVRAGFGPVEQWIAGEERFALTMLSVA
ncbi:MAG: L-histidine N(alpha)-methyltransferase [Acidobacteriota bacterium]